MKNKELFQENVQLFGDILNEEITSKNANKKLKEIRVLQKILSQRLKCFKRWHKIATSRNELITQTFNDEEVHLVPLLSLEFYPELEKYQDFNLTIEGVEYCCIMGND